METPELAVNDHVILRPINRRILPEVMSAYLEDPQAAKAALPWLKEGEEARRQIADLMIDLELHRNGDSIHFWAIHSMEDNSFVGMIGFGDELSGRLSIQSRILGAKELEKERNCTSLRGCHL